MKPGLLKLRQTIADEVEFVDLKPYSHNIISLALRGIAKGYGRREANKAIDDFGLEELGWQKEHARIREPKIGTFWQENDKRFKRIVKVIGYSGDKVVIRNLENQRETKANPARFNGKSRGYFEVALVGQEYFEKVRQYQTKNRKRKNK